MINTNIELISPIILLGINIYKLWNQSKYLISYLVFFLGNNIIIELLYQDKTPSKMNVNVINKGIKDLNLPTNISNGNAISIFYSLTFLFLVKNSPLWLLIELSIGFLFIYHSWKNKNQTPEQLIIGSCIGIGIGFFTYYITKQWLSAKTLYLDMI
jgi:hypothetical protein